MAGSGTLNTILLVPSARYSRLPDTLLAELFVEDMDGQLREFGVNDVVVGKRIGKLMSVLGGRLGAYRSALNAGDLDKLTAAIQPARQVPMRFWLPLLAALALSSCGPSGSGGPVEVAIIGAPDSLFQQGVRLPPPAQHIRAATQEGLVALDPVGQVVPAIAERWIVTEDGLSYIFRLRDSTWPGGDEITAADVREQLRAGLVRLRGTSLGLDLAKVRDIRAMTGRVIEVRLSSPMPDFLRLLAQPELEEIEINPLMVRATGAVAVDAVIWEEEA